MRWVMISNNCIVLKLIECFLIIKIVVVNLSYISKEGINQLVYGYILNNIRFIENHHDFL